MDARPWITATIIIGFLLTASNGVLAYRSSKQHLQSLGRRITTSDRYTREQHSDSKAPAETSDLEPTHTAHDHADLVLHALQASRLNLILAGVGLLISSAASVWALYL